MGDRSSAVLDWLSDVDPWLADVRARSPCLEACESYCGTLPDRRLERIDQMRLKPAFTTQIIFPFTRIAR